MQLLLTEEQQSWLAVVLIKLLHFGRAMERGLESQTCHLPYFQF